MSYQDEIRSQVNDKLIAAMTRGLTPWVKPWSAQKNTGHPANVVSRRPYRGVNPLLLHLSSLDHGFSSQWWGTYRQWQGLGAQVRKGERATKIIFWKSVTSKRINEAGKEERRTFPLMREYAIFNGDQCDGAERFQVKLDDAPVSLNFEPAQKVIDATGWDVRHIPGDTAAYHRPPLDFIVLPSKEQFATGPFGVAAYFSTAFHELLHASEHRLGWTGSYALGELRAELGASYLAAEVGLPAKENLENHAKYLDHWIRAMKADAKVIFQIASAASKGADLILSFSRQPEPAAEEFAAA